MKSGKRFSESAESTATSPRFFTSEDTAIIVSDVHSGGFTAGFNRKLEEDFLALLEYGRRYCTKVILLGDIFDYWMEYPDSRPEYGEQILAKLSELVTAGVPVLYITGNHDNWTRSAFCDIGIDVEHEYRIVTPDSRRVLLLHGDGLADLRWLHPRPLLHRFLRNNYFIKVYQKVLPENTGLLFMKWFSKISRYKSSHATKQRLDAWCRSILQRDWADVVICGHHHETRNEQTGAKRYLNTGNFFKDRSLLIYANKEFHFVNWDSNKFQLQSETYQPFGTD